MAIRTLLVDDHAILREGLRAFLDKLPDVVVVGEAADGREAAAKVAALSPDLVIIDVSMPELNGVEATRRIRELSEHTAVIGLSAHAEPRVVAEMLRAGASGFVAKAGPPEELIHAIAAVRVGGTYLSPQVARSVVQAFVRTTPDSSSAPDASPLSSREREVLQLIAEGHGTKEIADELCVSPKTIESHRRQIMGKLGIHSVAGLTKYALREGITALEVGTKA